MGANFTGITFDDCNVSPSDDGLINRTILPDGILSGCEISYSGSTLTMASGTLIACGRQFRHPAAQNWAVVDATTGYARLLITLDLTRSATDQTFDQGVDAVEYANDISGFPALVQQDLNAAGTKYQIVACVVSLGTGGISGIINTMPTVHPASADGGTLTVTAPAGATVTASKDGKTLTRVAGADGVVVFRGLESGTWTLSSTDGTQTASKTVEIVADYATTITFFAAIINITYPAGSTCTVTDSVTALTAPDASGHWDCEVGHSGTWVVKLDSGFCESVEVAQDGETYTVDKWYLFKGGDQHTDLTGGFEAILNANISDVISLNCPTSSVTSYARACTYEKIPISGFKTLYVVLKTVYIPDNNGSIIVGISNDKGGMRESYTAYIEPTGPYNFSDKIVSVDISSVGNNYAKFSMGQWQIGASANISEIYVTP